MLHRRLERVDHCVRSLMRIVRENHQVDVSRGDLSLGKNARLQPSEQARPVMPSEQDHGELKYLARLNESDRLEQFVESPEAARENDERRRIFDEHRLAHEEIPEVHERIEIRVGPLLEWKLDVASDRAAAALACAPVRSLHDSRTTAGDDRES